MPSILGQIIITMLNNRITMLSNIIAMCALNIILILNFFFEVTDICHSLS